MSWPALDKGTLLQPSAASTRESENSCSRLWLFRLPTSNGNSVRFNWPQETECTDIFFFFLFLRHKTKIMTLDTMPLKWNLFSLRKLYEIEKSTNYMKAISAGWVDQLWTRRLCSSHQELLKGKVKTASQGCGFSDYQHCWRVAWEYC